MTKRRPDLTQAMQLAFAKVWGLFPCIDCDADWELGGHVGPRPLFTWDQIEKDHRHELADDGPHVLENLFPRCCVEPTDHHQKKTIEQLKMRAHLKRAAKKHRGEHVSKHPMPKTGRKIPAHVNPWGKR